jgi:hypothetical protein
VSSESSAPSARDLERADVLEQTSDGKKFVVTATSRNTIACVGPSGEFLVPIEGLEADLAAGRIEVVR